MLALVAGLGLWLWLRPADVKGTRVRVSDASPADVRELRIEWPARNAALTLNRRDGAWRIVAPHEARAEPLQVERILSLLAATSELALPATDLGRFELDQPRARLVADGRTYALGGINPVTGSVYLQRGGEVLLLEPRYASVVPADPQALNDKRLLAASEQPAGFTFPQFKVMQERGKWTVRPAQGELSQDDVLRWVEGWQLAAALRAEPYTGPVPSSYIAIELRDGRRVPVGVTDQDGELAFTRYDEHMRYFFFANTARRLLAPPAASK